MNLAGVPTAGAGAQQVAEVVETEVSFIERGRLVNRSWSTSPAGISFHQQFLFNGQRKFGKATDVLLA